MLTFGNARLGNIHADLPTFFGFEQLGKTAARVQVHFQREGDFFFRQVGKIHGIQLFLKAAVGDFGHHQHLWLVMEAVEALNYVSERCFVRHRCVAVSAVFGQQGVHAVKFAVMLPALECIEHFLDQIIDKQHFQFDRRVVDRDRHIVCDVVAESTERAVVIRFHPLADEVRKAVNLHFRPGFLAVGKEQVFARFFGQPIFRCVEATRKGGMDRGLQHDGTCVLVFFQHVKQSRCKAEVARLEFRRILRTVNSNKIEHEIRLAAVFLKLRGHTVNIIFVDFIDHNMRACAVLAVAYVFEFFHKIFANEALCSGHEYIHKANLLVFLYCITKFGTVKYFSQIRFCQNEAVRRHPGDGATMIRLIV